MGLLIATRRAMLNVGGIPYDLRDEFNDGTIVAGSVHLTPASPGPGTRTVVDTDSKLSIGSRVLNLAPHSTPATGDPGYWLDLQARVLGKYLKLLINTVATNRFATIGLATAVGGTNINSGFILASSGDFKPIDANVTGPVIAARSAATDYELIVLLRAAGAYYYVKGGAFTDWTLLWVSSTGNTANISPMCTTNNSTYTVDFVRKLTRTFIPPITIYDTFTADNDTSLDEHTSDSTGPDGTTQPTDIQGTWVEQLGDWDIQGNKARAPTTGLGAPGSIATQETLVSDALIQVTVQSSVEIASSSTDLALRFSDASNLWLAFVDYPGNTLQIIERNAGGNTSRASAAVALVPTTDYDVKAIMSGQDITAYLDDANRITYGSAALNETATRHGLRTGAADGTFTFDDFTVNPLIDSRVSTEFDGV